MAGVRFSISVFLAIVLTMSSGIPSTAIDVSGEEDLARPGVGDPRVSYYREIPSVWPSFLRTGLQRDCWSKSESECRFDNSDGGHGFIVAPPCAELSQNFCIESLYVIDELGGRHVAAPIQRYRPNGEDFNRPFTVPAGGGKLTSREPWLWAFEDSYRDKRKYLVNLFTMVRWNKSDRAVELVGIEFAVAPMSRGAEPESVEQSLPAGIRVGLNLRLDWQVGGFLMGRISEPVIKQNIIRSGSLRSVTIEAAPEEVAKITGTKSTMPWAYDMMHFPRFAKESALIGDTANKVERVFRAYSRRTPVFACAGPNSGFYGTGTTNAAIYDVDPPNMKNGFLSYSVGGVHYLPDGTSLNQGKYVMTLRSDVARCIYGLGKVPIYASVSVTNAKGSREYATTTVGEKSGWLKLSAYGFSFSKKDIAVSISSKKRTIRCRAISNSGEIIKVSGAKPYCPAGYKRHKA